MKELIYKFEPEERRVLREIDKHLKTDKTSLQFGTSIDETFTKFKLLHSETAHHGLRVGSILRSVTKEMNFSPSTKVPLVLAGILHDIGKTADVLLVESTLTPEEALFVKGNKHAQVGGWILNGMNYPREIADLVTRHHSQGFWKDNPLPTALQLLMASDRYDAIQAERFYKPQTSHEQAWVILKKQFGTLFRPDLEEPFKKGLLNYVASSADN